MKKRTEFQKFKFYMTFSAILILIGIPMIFAT